MLCIQEDGVFSRSLQSNTITTVISGLSREPMGIEAISPSRQQLGEGKFHQSPYKICNYEEVNSSIHVYGGLSSDPAGIEAVVTGEQPLTRLQDTKHFEKNVILG